MGSSSGGREMMLLETYCCKWALSGTICQRYARERDRVVVVICCCHSCHYC